MPQIPFALSERSIPGQTGSPFMPSEGPIGASIQRAGAQAEQSWNRWQSILAHEREKEESLIKAQKEKEERLRKGADAEKLAYAFKDQVDVLANEMAQDPKKGGEFAKQQTEALFNKFQNETSDPDVFRLAQGSLLTERHRIESAGRLKDTQNLQNDLREITNRKVSEGIRDAAIASTPEERLQIKAGVVEHIAAMVREGVYTSDEGGKIIRQFEPQVAVAYFAELGRTNPTKVLSELNDKESEMARLLDPVKKQEFLAHFGVKANAQTEDAAYTHVFQKFNLNAPSGDYEGAIRELRNPASDVPAIKSLTTTQRHNIEVMVKGQEAYNAQEAARVFTEGKKKDLDLVGETFIKGDVAGAIRLTRDSPFIQGMDKVHIIDAFQKPAPEGKSNSNTYLEGTEKMYDASLPLEDKKVWLLKNRGNLNSSDFKHLSNVGMSAERSNDKAATKSGIDTLKAALITPGFTSQTQKERLDRAIKLYESGITEYKDTLNTPDKIKAFANQILKMPEFTSVNPVADMKADMAKIRGVGLNGTVSVTTPVKTKTVTIDGKQYKDGDIITQKDGTRGIVRVK
jgi:hypothetical protein